MKRIFKPLLHKLLGERRMRQLRALTRMPAASGRRPIVGEPERGKIAVLAPHMDDEVLGCGGTIGMHVRAGAQVAVIFLTDGRNGGGAITELPEPERAHKQRELVETRKREARRACAILGVSSITFLDAPDGQLGADKDVAKRLREALVREWPEIVYLPFFLDNHADHRVTAAVMLAAAQGTGLEFECRGYEIWTPLIPNWVVDIDATVELKKDALACYDSQLAEMNYLHTCIGLNAYRSSTVGTKRASYVEAFVALPLEDFRRLHAAQAAG